MIITQEMGFTSYIRYRMDDESIKALYKDYKHIRPEDTETYKDWEKENKLTGITKVQYSKEKGFQMHTRMRSEVERLQKQQDKILEERFAQFVSENKDAIYEAQIKAINATNNLILDEKIKEDNEKSKAWVLEHNQILSGCDIAISTLARDEKIDEINELLKIGYKVKTSSAGMVFLYWDKQYTPLITEIEKIYPLELNERVRHSTPRIETERVKGVYIPSNLHLEGYEYVKTIDFIPWGDN